MIIAVFIILNILSDDEQNIIHNEILQEILDGNPEMLKYADRMFRERESQNRRFDQMMESSTATALFNNSISDSSSDTPSGIRAFADSTNNSIVSELVAIRKELSYINYKMLLQQLQKAKLDFGVRMYIPNLMASVTPIPVKDWQKVVFTEGRFKKQTRDAILNYWKNKSDGITKPKKKK